jgi:hypothetical protein
MKTTVTLVVAATGRIVPSRRHAIATRSSASPSTSAASTGASPADPLSDSIRKIEKFGTPFAVTSSTTRYRLEPGIAPDGGALYSNTTKDVDYAKLCARWPRVEDDELFRCQRTVNRCERLSANELVVRWETTFVPEKLRWLHDLGEAWPGVDIELYDILDKMGELSRFRWRSLFQLFWNTATTGTMRLPAAKIESTSRLRFEGGAEGGADDDTAVRQTAMTLATHDETIDLVRCVNDGAVKNRRICRDLLEYLDCRKPPNTSLEAWDNQITDCVRWAEVPGMGMFDVDGLEDEGDRARFYGDATAVLAFMTVVFLVFGVGIGQWYFKGLEHERMMAAMLETGAF